MEVFNRSIHQSRLYGFNLDLLRNIYEYDDSIERKHKAYFFNEMRQDIWRASWIRWCSEINDINIRTVMEYLMTSWGVYDDVAFSEYYICQVFPSELHFVSCIEPTGKYHCTIYYDGRQIFTGWVLNEEQEQSEVFGDGNWTELDKMHVYTDYINRLYVYQNTGSY